LVTSLDPRPDRTIFGSTNMPLPESSIDLLVMISEPTRLRILNCLSAAPLFVSDLQDLLALPQPTISRHLTILRKAELVRDTAVSPYVLYRLRRDAGPRSRLLRAILEAVGGEERYRRERVRALERSRARGRGASEAREGASTG
jgi:ArsR family transcriptional regulator